jgi:hypothetical protein
MVVDHIDGNGLNNTISNLRVCNIRDNIHNSRKAKYKSSKYYGVHFTTIKSKIYNTKNSYYKVHLQANGKNIQKFFKNEIDAARYYDFICIENGLIFKKLNGV